MLRMYTDNKKGEGKKRRGKKDGHFKTNKSENEEKPQHDPHLNLTVDRKDMFLNLDGKRCEL